MAKAFLIMAFTVFISFGARSQEVFATSIGISGGYVEDGYGGMINFNFQKDRYSYWHFGVFAGFSQDRESEGYVIPYNVINFQPGYFFRVFESSGFKPVSVYLGAGALGGYEIINNGSSELDNGAIINAKSQFIYGGFVGVELDYAFSKSFSLVGKANEYYHVNSDVGNWYPYFAVGLRYYLF